MGGDLFNCDKCRMARRNYCDTDLRWPQSRGPAPYPMYSIEGVIDTRTCLLPMVTSQSRALVRLHGRIEHHLPFAGGQMDQPAVVMEAMEVIAHTVNSINEERRKNKPHGRR